MVAQELDHEQLEIAGILYGAEWDAREAALSVPDLLTLIVAAHVGTEKVRHLGTLLAYAHDTGCTTHRRRTPVDDIEALVSLWVNVLVDLTAAHDHAARSAADEQTDALLGPLLTAPIKQVRQFAQVLAQHLREDERVPFLVWSTFDRLIAPLILLGPEGKTVKLKTDLATEIAQLVEHQLNRGELVAAMAAALQWRTPETLEKVKTGLQAGAKPRVRGGQSCLFLGIEDASGKEIAQVVL